MVFLIRYCFTENRAWVVLRVVSLVRKRRGKGLLNLRFKWVVISSLFYVMYAVPKAEYMLRHPEKYTDEEKFAFAMKIVGHMKKRARTETLVYGAENIPDEQGCIMYGNHQGKYDALGILLSLDKPCGVLWEKKQASRFLSRQVCGLINGVAIDLTDIRAKVRSIKEVSDRVKDGQNFLIFPEGGYADNHNELQEFFSGCFACSQASKGPIVPVVVYDSYKSMNSNTFEKVTTQVHYLRPIYYNEYQGMKKPEICELVKSRISTKLEEIKNCEREKKVI